LEARYLQAERRGDQAFTNRFYQMKSSQCFSALKAQRKSAKGKRSVALGIRNKHVRPDRALVKR